MPLAVRLPAVLMLLTISLGACRGGEEPARQYELQGQILAIKPDANEVLIRHGDIEHFMPGMTMPFKVHDGALLADKAPGDLVRAQLMVSPDQAWLATLEKTGTAPLEERAEIPPASFVVPLQPGDAVPETTLTDQDAAPLSLADWRNTAVVVTFIYVRCPLPQFCPLMDRRFVELQRVAASDPALAGRVKLLSVSFDPAHDTPAALKAHAARLGADPAVWRFATADEDVVDRFAATFGVNVMREPDGTITHNLRTAVIAPDGRVVAVYSGAEWTAAQAVDDLRRAVATTASRR
jgi:protein SCO1